MTLAERLDAYERLLRLDKPIGTLLLAWPTLWALWLASAGNPGWILAWVFLFGTLLMRSAGCAINDFADRHFDGKVERTRDRPLAKGEIAPWEALVVAGLLVATAGAVVIALLNRYVLGLAIGALVITIVYPFTKRFFAMPQAVLGVAFSFGIPMAFAAIHERVPMYAWVIVAATWCWVVAYDTLYAMVDRDDDRRLGLQTSAILFGARDRLIIGVLYALFSAGMLVVGHLYQRGATYFLAVLLATAIAGVLVHKVRHRDRASCFQAFLANQWIGAVIFAGIALDYTKTGRW
jgi:4-hydroxybenzoate polyprenyltransferase